MRHSAGSLASTGARQSTRSACSTGLAKLWASGRSRTAGRAWRPCAIGSWSAAGDPGSVAVAIEVPHGPVVDALLDRGFAVYAINPKQLDRLRDRISVAGAKDDRRDARVAAAGLRTDRPLFRRVLAGDPTVIELREWSRLAEELQQERVRLGHRIRQQLWRYSPQLLALSDDMTAEWVLALWTLAPTPAKAARLREATLARLLRQHRIRKLDAPAVLGILRQPAITVAPGVTEAAVLHLRSLVARLRLANQEFHQAARKLEELCTALSETDAAAPDSGPGDAAIFVRCPGSVRSRSPPCSPRPPGHSRAGTMRPSEPCRAWPRSPSAAARRGLSSCGMPPRSGCARRCSTGPASPCRSTAHAAAAMRLSEPGAPRMAGPCAASATGCSGSPACCCSVRPCSTPTTVHRQGRRSEPSLSETRGHPFAPTGPRLSAACQCCPEGRAASP